MATSSVKGGWTPSDAPRLDGKVAIVTGATGGLGYETALGLARYGATTILAGRNPDKGAQAFACIQGEIPAAQVRFELLDLNSLASVARFATAQDGVIDILINNAAVMGLPNRERTEDGFERQIGVNYLAHFALTLRLLDAIRAAPAGGRIVNIASLAHRRATLDLDDFQSDKSYSPMGAYGRSKLAMLIFAIELQRRAEKNGWNLLSMAAHPGWARTDIIGNGIAGQHGVCMACSDIADLIGHHPPRDLRILDAKRAAEAAANLRLRHLDDRHPHVGQQFSWLLLHAQLPQA